MGVLDKILLSKRAELPLLRNRKLPAPPSSVPELSLRRNPGEPLRLLCEFKRHSPSAGALSTALSVEERTKRYQEGGAALISVLCDGPFFHGSFDDLLAASKAQPGPVLCKEFIIDECQLDAAQAYGASAVLLIARCLRDDELRRFIEASQERHLVPLVEIFSQEEKQRALDAGATLVGVNARDLDTLEMNMTRAEEVLESLPPYVTACHLSGVKSPDNVAKIASGRADAALIGEILMRQDDPSELLSQFISRAQ